MLIFSFNFNFSLNYLLVNLKLLRTIEYFKKEKGKEGESTGEQRERAGEEGRGREEGKRGRWEKGREYGERREYILINKGSDNVQRCMPWRCGWVGGACS